MKIDSIKVEEGKELDTVYAVLEIKFQGTMTWIL